MSVSRSRTQEPDDAISLREYFETRLDALERLVMARLDAMQLASDSRRVALDTRLEQMNEIRGQLATQRADFVTTDRLESLLTSGQVERRTFNEKFDTLANQVNAQATLAREQTQKDLDVQRNRTDEGFKTVNADIRSLRESRSAGAGLQTGVRDLVPWLSLGCAGLSMLFTLGCAGLSVLLTIIGMAGAAVIFVVTHG